MSVLVSGMKMPKDCTECRFAYDGMCLANWGRKSKIDVTNYCPLIELPAEHGRLGDLDAMAFDESEAYMSAQAKLGRDVITTGINSIVHRKIQLLIMDTPTIIEAEEVSDG